MMKTVKAGGLVDRFVKAMKAVPAKNAAALIAALSVITSALGVSALVHRSNSVHEARAARDGRTLPVVLPSPTPAPTASPATAQAALTPPARFVRKRSPKQLPTRHSESDFRIGKAGGLRVTLTPDRPTVGAGDLITFTIRVHDDSASLIIQEGMVFGDGSSSLFTHTDFECARSGPNPDPPLDRTLTYKRGFRKEGVYTPKVLIGTGGCSSEEEVVEATTSVVIEKRLIVPSNGPIAPRAFAHQSWPPGTSRSNTIYISPIGFDDDGFISRIAIDWGDGEPPTTIDYSLSECEDPQSYWPSSSRREDKSHQYAAKGQYTIKVTVISTGCDGLFSQQREATTTVTVPSSPPGS